MNSIRAAIELLPIVVTAVTLFWTSHLVKNGLIDNCQFKRTNAVLEACLPDTNAVVTFNTTDKFVSKECWAYDQPFEGSDIWMNVTPSPNSTGTESEDEFDNNTSIGSAEFAGYVGDIWFSNHYNYLYMTFFYILITSPVFVCWESERRSLEAFRMQIVKPFPSETIVKYFCHTFSLFYFLLVVLEVFIPFLQMEITTKYFGPGFYTYGFNVLGYFFGLIENDPMDEMLPLLVDCKFDRVNTQWAYEESYAMCTFEMNAFSQWILLFFWYWLACVALVSILHLITLVVRVSMRLHAIIKMNRNAQPNLSNLHGKPASYEMSSGTNSDSNTVSEDNDNNARRTEVTDLGNGLEILSDMSDDDSSCISFPSSCYGQVIPPMDDKIAREAVPAFLLDLNDPNWYDDDNVFKFAEAEDVFCNVDDMDSFSGIVIRVPTEIDSD